MKEVKNGAVIFVVTVLAVIVASYAMKKSKELTEKK